MILVRLCSKINLASWRSSFASHSNQCSKLSAICMNGNHFWLLRLLRQSRVSAPTTKSEHNDGPLLPCFLSARQYFDMMVKSYTCARSTRPWDFSYSSWTLLVWMLPLIRCLDPEWKRKESHKRRSFLSAVAYDIMKPMIDYRSQSANISHIPTISRAIHARDRRRTSRINVCAISQQETWSMPELPTI